MKKLLLVACCVGLFASTAVCEERRVLRSEWSPVERKDTFLDRLIIALGPDVEKATREIPDEFDCRVLKSKTVPGAVNGVCLTWTDEKTGKIFLKFMAEGVLAAIWAWYPDGRLHEILFPGHWV